MHSDNSSPSRFLKLWFSKISDSTITIEQKSLKLLSASQSIRLESTKSADKRREYLLSRALMRHALGECFRRRPDDWEFIEKTGELPQIINLPADTFISLSHSNGYIFFAIAGCPVGIDLEAGNRPRNFAALAEMFMSEEERAQLVQTGTDEANYFYRTWCAKEAYYKALPLSEQSTTSFAKIRYSDLVESRNGWQLIEGKFQHLLFAVTIKSKPEQISCHQYGTTNELANEVQIFEGSNSGWHSP